MYMRFVVDRNVVMRRIPVAVDVTPMFRSKILYQVIIIIIIIIIPCCFYISGLLHLIYTYTHFIL